MPYDIENSDINPLNVLTLTETFELKGSKGTVFPFIRLRQYLLCCHVHVSPQVVAEVCGSCENPKVENYWPVCIKGEQFLVPKENGCIENYIRTELQQDLYKNWRHYFIDQPADYIKVASSLTGHEVNTGKRDIANPEHYESIRKEKGRNDGRSYGETIPADDGTDNPLIYREEGEAGVQPR